MSSPRSQELMNKNSQHEFRFTGQYGLQIACTRWKSRGWFGSHPFCTINLVIGRLYGRDST